MLQKYILEGLGAFFWMLAVVMTGGEAGAWAVGVTVAVFIWLAPHTATAAFNPALSVASVMRGDADRGELALTILAQFVGAVLAVLIAGYLLSATGVSVFHARANDPLGALMAEFIGVFAITLAGLSLGLTTKSQPVWLRGLAVGLMLAAATTALGKVSGAAFNPAVALGQSLIGNFAWSDIWIYLFGDMLGAAAAATVYGSLSADEVAS